MQAQFDYDYVFCGRHAHVFVKTEVTSSYTDQVSKTAHGTLISVHSNLVEELNDTYGKVLEAQGASTSGESRSALTAPLRSERLRVQTPKGPKEFLLGDQMDAYETMVSDQQAKLKKLWSEWRDVCAEIQELSQEVEDESKIGSKVGVEKLSKEARTQIGELGNDAMAQLAEVEKEDVAKGKELKRRMLAAVQASLMEV